MKKETLLVINTGSSNIKFQLFSNDVALDCLIKGKIETSGAHFLFSAQVFVENESTVSFPIPNADLKYALNAILEWIEAQDQHWQINTIAHRVVHGGEDFTKSVAVTPEVIEALKSLSVLAPLHQPYNLIGLEVMTQLKPNALQIACFDTAFHSHHNELFTSYALPKRLRDQGIRRFGFHGLSYEWIVHTLRLTHPVLAQGRIIAAHLGNGASLCALKEGKSIDTSMGMTALDGLPMGTRCGQLDPGVVIYCIRELGFSADDIESIFYHDSGLKGLSGLTHDVAKLLNSKAPEAEFALDYFCLKTAQFMGQMAIALGAVDGIVFTGGIGENSAFIRTRILSHLDCFKPFQDCVIPANEERIMAMHALDLMKQQKDIT